MKDWRYLSRITLYFCVPLYFNKYILMKKKKRKRGALFSHHDEHIQTIPKHPFYFNRRL